MWPIFFGLEGQDTPPTLDGVEDAGALALMRAFAVLTAFCAAQSFRYAKSALPFGGIVAPKFLVAARSMLHEYEDDDRRDPDVTSLQIRMLLSISFQQASGETGLAWHFVGEAGLIARRLRLYRESVLMQYTPLEAAMLRNVFWSLYTADASAECMQNRGVVLHEPLFDAELNLLDGAGQIPLIEADTSTSTVSLFEQQLSQSFHQIRRTWALAARLLRAIRAFGRTSHSIDPQLFSGTQQITALALMYSQFTAALDNMPRVLQPPVVFAQNDSTVTEFERQCYISLRYRLLSAYHYAKLRATHECKNLGLASVVGLQDGEATLANEQVNVARDFIHNLQSVEFHFLEELGEPEVCDRPRSVGHVGADTVKQVEVIRGVGSILLAITQGSGDAISRQRALTHLNVLVDILARLDSQASAKLTTQLPHLDRLPGARRETSEWEKV
jgi:hypothetical protein